jgi:hypothetical protein
MRIEICDVPIYAPAPLLSKTLIENKKLKSKNRTLEYVVVATVVVGFLCAAAYVRARRDVEKLKLKEKD